MKNGNIFIMNKTNGDSMWPLISKEDKIYIKYKKFQELKVGEIILFKDKEFILHRIYKITDNQLVTKGDNNNENDLKLIKEKDYYGILIKIDKKRFNLTIKEPFLTIYFKYILQFHSIIKKIKTIRK
jgi:signal peptidase I